MKQKTFRAPMAFKDEGEAGSFVAVFSTLNVKDYHGDVTLPGAFEAGQAVVIEPWNHDWSLPAGKGTVMADGEKAWIEGQFFLTTQAGRENYETVKALGELAEWSYTFDVVEASRGNFDGQPVQFLRKLDVVGVGPVTRGAGIGTRTVAIKAAVGRQDDAKETDNVGGEVGADDAADKPSGVGPGVLLAQIELELLED